LKWIEEYKTASRINVSDGWMLLNLNVYLASKVYVIRLGVRSESILVSWFFSLDDFFSLATFDINHASIQPPLAVARF